VTAPAEARGFRGFGGAGIGLGLAAGALAAGCRLWPFGIQLRPSLLWIWLWAALLRIRPQLRLPWRSAVPIRLLLNNKARRNPGFCLFRT
jgi:hypothetical protein